MAVKAKLREYFRNDYQPGEKALVRKIDFFILTFCCLSYFTNYVSRDHEIVVNGDAYFIPTIIPYESSTNRVRLDIA